MQRLQRVASPFTGRNGEVAIGGFRERHVAMKPLEQVLTVALRSQQTAAGPAQRAALEQPLLGPVAPCGL